MVDPGLVGVLALVAFLPPLVFAASVRFVERHHREPTRHLVGAFLWGALGGTTLTLLLSSVLDDRPSALAGLGLTRAVIAAVVFAPMLEEFLKVLGLRWVRDKQVEPEDGFVYGAVAGFGFAATENAVYAALAWYEGGASLYWATVAVRSLSTALMHASASAILGYAIWKVRLGRAGDPTLALHYGAAVAIHALFNVAASHDLMVGAVLAALLALVVLGSVVLRVVQMDRRAAKAGSVATDDGA